MVGIPATPTLIVGREAEIAAVSELLRDPQVRLVTLLGPAGVGKTRLALEVASRLADAFDDGIAFIDLTPVDDPARLFQAIAAAVGVEEGGGEPLDDVLKRFFSHRTMLLVLDNFEQIEQAAAAVAQLLSAAQGLKALVTSRVPLQVSWERRFPVSPLGLPDLLQDPGIEDVRDKSALALFTQRAGAILPDFMLTKDNYRTVAEICVRLDGLPLALELAAAHVDTRSLDDILGGLRDSGLDVLVSGARDLPARHQTLRSAIEWSERLLDEAEREMFVRLAAFSGTFTAEAAAAVCQEERGTATRTLDSLVRTNLVRFEAATGRYRLLEMIREFALRRLSETGLEEETRLRHLQWFSALAESAEPHLRRHDQKSWMDRLEADHDNFRTALGWCLRTGRLEEGLRLAAALAWLWQVRSHFVEGSSWFAAFFGAAEGHATVKAHTQMRALMNASWLALMLGQAEQRVAYAEDCLRLADELGDDTYRCWALQLIARSYYRPDPDRARKLLLESFVAAESADDEACLRWTYHCLGVASESAGHYQRAIEESSQAIALHREAGDANFLLWTLGVLGRSEVQLGLFDSARQRFKEAIIIARDLPSLGGLEGALNALARLADAEGKFELAMCLVGVAERVRERSGSNLTGTFGGQDYLSSTLTKLGEVRATAARTRGRSMSLDEAIALALSDDAFETGSPVSTPHALSPRQVEVLALIAQGKTNREIAEALVLSERTVQRHIADLYLKIDVRNRAEATSFALKQLT